MAWEIQHLANIQASEPATKAITIVANRHQMLVLVLGSTDGRDYRITTATFDGNTLTRPAGFPVRYNDDGKATVDLMYIDISGKTSGIYNLYYNVSTGSPDDGGIAYFLVRGGDQSNLIADSDANTGNGGNASTALATTRASSMLIDVFFSDRNANLTVGASQTQIFQYDPPGTSGTDRMGASYKEVTAIGAQQMYWTGSNEEWAHGAIAINKAHNSGAFILDVL